MTENATAAEQLAKHEQSHAEAELYDNPGARTAKGCEPIGWVVALRYADGMHDLDHCGLFGTREEAEADAVSPEHAAGLDDGEGWVPCAVVPVKDGQGE